MPDTARVTASNLHTSAQQHLAAALAFYTQHGQQGSAIGELTAGLLAMSVQLQRIELAVMAAQEV